MLGMIILENFKAFGQRQAIPLAPITLIFGANSAGKSSILQSLLLLKQSMEPQEHGGVLRFTGELVDLGNFREMVYRHNVVKGCEISVLPGSADGRWPHLDTSYWPYELRPKQAAGLGLRFGQDKAKHGATVRSLPFYWDTAGSPVFLLSRMQKVPPFKLYDRIATMAHEHHIDVNSLFQVESVSFEHRLLVEMALEAQRRDLFRTFAGSLVQAVLDRMDHDLEDVPALTEPAPAGSTASTSGTWLSNSSMNLSNDRALCLRGLWAERLFPTAEDLDVPGQDPELFDPDDLPQGSIFSILRAIRVEGVAGMPYVPDAVQYVYGPMTYVEELLPSPFPDLTALAVRFSQETRDAIGRIVYVSPLREMPTRVRLTSARPATEIGSRGEHLAEILRLRPNLVREVNDALENLGIEYAFDEGFSGDEAPDTVRLRLTDTDGIKLSIRDIGFGISQLLPVIAQSLLSRQATVLIEQPELHLHPRLQAELGSFFARCIRNPQGNQFIIETHSEHLILRLQRLIRHGQLKASDVSVLYVNKGERGARCLQLRLDEAGAFIDNWPDGFFEEGFKEILS